MSALLNDLKYGLRMLAKRPGFTAMCVGLGLPVAWLVVRLLRSVVYGVKPQDPFTLFGAAVLIMAVGLLAAWLPARRAAKIDPMVALRHE